MLNLRSAYRVLIRERAAGPEASPSSNVRNSQNPPPTKRYYQEKLKGNRTNARNVTLVQSVPPDKVINRIFSHPANRMSRRYRDLRVVRADGRQATLLDRVKGYSDKFVIVLLEKSQ
jgi:hypothetical protein